MIVDADVLGYYRHGDGKGDVVVVQILGGDYNGTFLASKTKRQRLHHGPLGPPSQIFFYGRVPTAVVIMTVVGVMAIVTVLVIETIMASSQTFGFKPGIKYKKCVPG